MPGWTLAVDIPVGRADLHMDDVVLEAGGGTAGRARPARILLMYRLPESVSAAGSIPTAW